MIRKVFVPLFIHLCLKTTTFNQHNCMLPRVDKTLDVADVLVRLNECMHKSTCTFLNTAPKLLLRVHIIKYA